MLHRIRQMLKQNTNGRRPYGGMLTLKTLRYKFIIAFNTGLFQSLQDVDFARCIFLNHGFNQILRLGIQNYHRLKTVQSKFNILTRLMPI